MDETSSEVGFYTFLYIILSKLTDLLSLTDSRSGAPSVLQYMIVNVDCKYCGISLF